MKLLRLFFCLIVLACTAVSAFAHSGTIKGSVLSQENQIFLEGASVLVRNEPHCGTTTGKMGAYQLSNLQDGTYEVVVSFLGYQPAVQVVEVTNGNTTELNFSLARQLVNLAEVTVSSAQATTLQAISALDLSLRPIQSSQDMLRSVPGLFIAQHAGGGKAEQIFLRGFDSDHGTDVRLTVDGLPVNMVSHAHGQGYADLHFLIPETIKSVAYGKGPYEASEGNFATAGYAKFATYTALPQSTIKLEGGRFGTVRALGMFDLLGKEAQQQQQYAYLATEYMFTDGYFDSPQHFNRLNLMGRYHGRVGEGKMLSLSLSTFRSRWDASGQIPARAVEDGRISRFGAIDNTEGGYTSRHNANLQLTTTLPNGATLENQVYLVNYNFDLFSNFSFFMQDSVHGDQIRQRENRMIYGTQSTYSQAGTWLGKFLQSEAGISIRYDVVNGSELSRTKARNITLSEVKQGDIGEVNAAAYIREELELSSRWRLQAALRYDHFRFTYQDRLLTDSTYKLQATQQQQISPKLQLFYTHSNDLQVYASAGKGFHSNDTRVSVTTGRKDVLPAAYGAEIGFSYKPFPAMVLNGAIWLLDLDQELVYVGDEGIVEPNGKSRRHGFDLTARYQLHESYFADVDVNVARPRFRKLAEGQNHIPLAPTVTSTGGITKRSETGWFGSLRYRYLKNRPANEDYSLTANGYLLLDAVAGYTVGSIELKLTAENLLNEAWEEAQFETTSRLRSEPIPVTEMHFTPGTPFFVKASAAFRF